MSAFAKYQLTPGANNVHGRLARLYEAGTSGKGALVAQCAAGGMMLKECGILETITMLDQHPAYQEGTPSARRTILLNELIALIGNAPIVHQPVESPITIQEAAPLEPPSPAPQTPAVSEPEASSGSSGPNLPKIGM